MLPLVVNRIESLDEVRANVNNVFASLRTMSFEVADER